MAKSFLEFSSACCSQFHVVSASVDRLKSHGFTLLREVDPGWVDVLKPGGKYFLTRNQSSLVAFTVGGGYKSGSGFTIIGAHTDSPVLKLKPVTSLTKSGIVQLDVACYGGGLWYTWFDRDLGLSGRVIIKEKKNQNLISKLVRISKPILKIPSLAIHLNREVNDKGFCPNKQSHLHPILASQVKVALWNQDEKDEKEKNEKIEKSDHHPLLLRVLSSELGVSPCDIVDFELSLYDVQPPTIGGALDEFIFARGLDNQMMSFVALQALIDSSNDSESLSRDLNIRLVGLFDNEEVGSESLMGAGSSMLEQILRRINNTKNQHPDNHSDNYDCAIRKSLLVSADMAHAVHPNYPECHEENHRPQMHGGLVVKDNANLRYATNSISTLLITEIAKGINIKLQKFAVRNDAMCGSTIGPILSTSLGIRTVDVGIPQLSMHSIREMCGVDDVVSAHKLFVEIFKQFPHIDKTLVIEGEQ